MSMKFSPHALIVIDVQQGLFQKSTPIYQAEALLQKLVDLVQRAQRAGATVVFVQHSDEKYLVYGSEAWQLHPRLQALQPDLLVHKRHGNAFEDTDLEAELKKRGIREVTLCGLVTHGCVRATCQGALALGYETLLVQDAHSSYSKQAAEMIEKWNAALGEAGAKLVDSDDLFA